MALGVMGYSKFFINLMLLFSFFWAAQAFATTDHDSEIESSEVELKFLVNDLTKIPSSILSAMQSGAEHPFILKRGFVVQEYVLVNQENLKAFLEAIKKAGVPFGDVQLQSLFLEPGAAKEIRMMSKSVKIAGKRVEIFQATVKGPGGLAVKQLETPENLTADQMDALKKMFAEWRPKVVSQAKKAYFEIANTNIQGQPIYRADGLLQPVELDMFIVGGKSNPKPIFLNGEIEFHGKTPEDAVASAGSWLNDASLRSSYFSTNLTEMAGSKSRDIALHGVPGPLTRALEPYLPTNQAIVDRVIAEFRTWAHPEVTDLVLNDKEHWQATKEVSFLDVISAAMSSKGDIHKLTLDLERKNEGKNFRIRLPFSDRSIFIFQNREDIAKVLKKKSELSFVNKNFDTSHGHFNSINSVDTSDELWESLHYELLEIFKRKKISPIMDKYKDILIGRETYEITETLEDYFLKVWAEYCFGPTEVKGFAKLRLQLVDTLTKVFHANRANRVPVIGGLTSKFNRWRYASELRQVDEGLAALVQSAIDSKQGAFYELYEKLKSKYPNAFQITVDNAFLGILVYDFIHIILADATANIAKFPDVNRKGQVQRSIHDSFLYPFRFRVAGEDFGDVQTGDYCVLNLKRAGLYFSFGARVCPGANLFKEIQTKFLDIFSDYDLRMLNPDAPIETTGNEDLPFMTSKHQVTVKRCPFSRLFGSESTQPKKVTKNLVLIGAPGSGKGTVGAQLKEKYAIPHISAGDIVRAEIQARTPFGLKVEEMTAKGQLLPDGSDLMAQLFEAVKNRLLKDDCKNGFILDGIPRTGAQAKQLTTVLSSVGKKLDAVILLDVGRETLVNRLAGRQICKGCSLSYHKIFQPPKVASTCDKCCKPLTERPDDREDVVQSRLATHEKEVSPIIDYYKNENLLYSVAGEGTPDQVFESLTTLLTKLEQKK